MLKADEKEPPPGSHQEMLIPEAMRKEWGDYVYWDKASSAPEPLTRDQVGAKSAWPLFDLVSEYAAHFDAKTAEKTWAPAEGVLALARHVAKVPGTTLFAVGMGPNQFFSNDKRQRRLYLGEELAPQALLPGFVPEDCLG